MKNPSAPSVLCKSRLVVRSGYDLLTKQVEYAYEMRAEPGHGELRLRPDHPLVRAFKASLVSGRPPDDWQLVLLHDEVGKPPIVVGTFVRTLGARFLFFPSVGMLLRRDASSREKSAELALLEGASLDHVTLDPRDSRGQRGGHLTLLGREGRDRHGWKFRTRPQGGWHYWFSMLSPTLDPFPRLPAHLSMTFSSGRVDLTERFAAFAERGGVANIELPSPPLSGQSFFQWDFWLCEANSSMARTEIRPVPFFLEPRLVQGAPKVQKGDFHLLEVGFAAGERVAVAISLLGGHISSPVFLRAELNY